jgi:hypothetical protein
MRAHVLFQCSRSLQHELHLLSIARQAEKGKKEEGEGAIRLLRLALACFVLKMVTSIMQLTSNRC